MTPARLAAARVLQAIDRGRTTLAAEIDAQRAGIDDERDRGLLLELAAGTLRWRNEIDARIGVVSDRPIEALDSAVRATLRLGVYQLTHLDRIPAHAVVHEAVDVTRALGRPRAAGFVNAVLRRVAAGQSDRALPPAAGPSSSLAEQTAYLSIVGSHPAWLVKRWLARFGFEAAAAWCQFNNAAPNVTLRSAGRLDAAAMLDVLERAGLTPVRARWLSDAVVLPPGSSGRMPGGLPAEIVVQDEGSQLVAHALGARPGERVLDACAAPGGKTVVLATSLAGAGQLVASDLRPARVRLLRAALQHAAVQVPVVQLDAARGFPFGPVFDGVLLDAPCSGLGTLRRDPDIKWARSERDLVPFATAQGAMLARAADTVRPGGRLLYATCSSEPEENAEVVRAFLEAHAEFRQAPIRFGPAVVDGGHLLDQSGSLCTLPFRDGLDAFYAALLVRRQAA